MRLYFKGLLHGAMLIYLTFTTLAVKEQKKDLDVYRRKCGPISEDDRKKYKTKCPKGKKVDKTKPKNPIGFA